MRQNIAHSYWRRLRKLSALSIARVLLMALCSGALGATVALMIPTLAKNRVEGMAISRLSGIIMLGLSAALLLPSPYRYAMGVLPSFWMTELVFGGSVWNTVPALLTSALLSLLLFRYSGNGFCE